MESQEKLIGVLPRPGIKRDGTEFDGGYYTDALWCRWQRGRPRKIGGYQRISNEFPYPCRAVTGYTRTGIFYVHAGSPGNLSQQQFDFNGGSGSVTDRTPSALTDDDDNMWQFDVMYDGGSNESRLIAHAAPNLTNIDNPVQAPIFYGDAFDVTALTDIADSDVAGGIVVLYPYLFGLDIDGGVIWSVANTPGDFTGAGSGSARITGMKVVRGFSTRGGAGNNPAGILFALDALIRVTFSGGAAVFNFDRVAEGYSLLAQNAICEYDGIYYWIGRDRFLMYNGVIQETVNDMNLNYFFDNLNYPYRNKVWCMPNPRWGEIWYGWPKYPSTECNWVHIYNKRENTWYDGPLSRIAGHYDGVFPYPIMFDNTVSGTDKTKLWMHEYGVDEVDGLQTAAIRSFYETSEMSLVSPEQGAGVDLNMYVKRIEPDYIMSGSGIISLIGRKYPQSTELITKTFDVDGTTEKIDCQVQGRLIRYRYENNVAGGTYQAGKTLLLVGPKDKRPVG